MRKSGRYNIDIVRSAVLRTRSHWEVNAPGFREADSPVSVRRTAACEASPCVCCFQPARCLGLRLRPETNGASPLPKWRGVRERIKSGRGEAALVSGALFRRQLPREESSSELLIWPALALGKGVVSYLAIVPRKVS